MQSKKENGKNEAKKRKMKKNTTAAHTNKQINKQTTRKTEWNSRITLYAVHCLVFSWHSRRIEMTMLSSTAMPKCSLNHANICLLLNSLGCICARSNRNEIAMHTVSVAIYYLPKKMHTRYCTLNGAQHNTTESINDERNDEKWSHRIKNSQE